MKRTTIYFSECEHNGDLDEYIEDIEKSGGKVIHAAINTEEETAMCQVDIIDDDFAERFKKTNAYDFSNLCN
jgi:predicted enzyme related to lactoylglutathione lyase